MGVVVIEAHANGTATKQPPHIPSESIYSRDFFCKPKNYRKLAAQGTFSGVFYIRNGHQFPMQKDIDRGDLALETVKPGLEWKLHAYEAQIFLLAMLKRVGDLYIVEGKYPEKELFPASYRQARMLASMLRPDPF